MATNRSISSQSGMMRTDIDISDALEDFEKGVANSRSLLTPAKKAARKIMKPRMVAIYGGASGGPKKITGALSKKSAVQVKGIWYKKSKIGLAIVGLKTNNESEHSVDLKKAHSMEKWHASQIAMGNRGKYRTSRGTVSNPLANDKTTLGNRPWKINSSVELGTKVVRKKPKSVVIVKRNPSRIAHLIEKGHKFPKGGNARAYRVVEKAEMQTSKAVQVMLISESRKASEKAAKIAASKVKK